MEKEYCPYCMNPIEAGQPCSTCGFTTDTYTPSLHHLPPGTLLKNRYLVGRVLGEGGFGITYIGYDLQLEIKVAIKEYFPTDRASRVASASLSISSYSASAESYYESGKARFLQEARTMAKLDKQKTIVSVRDFFELNNTAYIVMEYAEGSTFKELVAKRGGGIPPKELLPMIEPLFSALDAMHRLDLIHRDISPENLILENGEVRLLDFGCARETESGETTLTIALKHGYAPAEQYQNKGQGPWSDVYALSATIYYCLTGRKPPQSMDRLAEDNLILPRKLGIDLTEQQEKALLRGMSIRPRQRFQSVMDLYAALYQQAEPPVYKPKHTFPHKRTLLLAAGAALLMLIAAAILVFLLPSSLQEDPFANAITLTHETKEEFLFLLANESVPSIILTDGIFMVQEEVQIDKPVWITETANVNFLSPISITGNGAITVDGTASVDSLLRIQDGGTVLVGDMAELCCAYIWADHADDLRLAKGGRISIAAGTFIQIEDIPNNAFLTLSEEELFADAVHVTTEEEFRLELLRRSCPIVIDADIDISKKSISVVQTVPVLISENATVIASGQDWCIEETAVLINHGSLSGNLQTAENAEKIINYGEMNVTLTMNSLDASCLNYGTMRIPQGTVSGYFLNLGNVLVSSEADSSGKVKDSNCGLMIRYVPFYNVGTITVEQNAYVSVLNGMLFMNIGTIQIGAYGKWHNEGYITNCGTILCTDETGIFTNCGMVRNDSPTGVMDLEKADSTASFNSGMISYYFQSKIIFPEGFHQKNGTLFPLDTTLQDGYCSVTTPEEFLYAMEEERYKGIVLYSDITLNAELTIHKEVIAFSFLNAPYGLTVSGENALFFGNLDLNGSNFTAEEGSTACFSSLRNCSGITVTDSTVLLQGSTELTETAFLHLNGQRSGGNFITLGYLSLHGSQVQISRGNWDSYSLVRLYGCTMELLEGEFSLHSSAFFMDEASTLINHGSFSAHTFSGDCIELMGTAYNYGKCILCEGDKIFGGHFTNYGSMHLSGSNYVSGSFDNQGEITFYGDSSTDLLPTDGGTIKGIRKKSAQ